MSNDKAIVIKRSKAPDSLLNPILWGIFILYIVICMYSITHHELWGDELHSWNIAKASNNFFDLISNTRYEGHPPLWYTILWSISKFTHNLIYVQLVHGIFACIIVFLILFFSPFSFITRILLPFGYYFLYEYAVLSRNYAIAVLFVLCICLIMHKEFKYKIFLYYILLFLMSNSHFIAMILAVSVHLYFLILQIERKKTKPELALHIALGGVIFLSTLYFVFPPTDSQLNVQFWVNKWKVNQIKAVVQLPIRAFIPIPAWWNYQFWNSEFLLEAKNKYGLLKFINPLVVLMLIGIGIFILRRNKKGFILFFANVVLTFIIVMTVFALATARYSGFVFIGFIVAYWLNCSERTEDFKSNWLVNILLILQLIGGIFITIKDMLLPFSNAYKVNELLQEVPENEKTVTDYWALNVISAYADRPFYCVDMEKEMTFILWGSDIAAMRKKPNRYYQGISNFFRKEGINKLYMVSTGSLQSLYKVDPKLSTAFKIILVDKREGAIEKGSNLYLYQINALTP